MSQSTRSCMLIAAALVSSCASTPSDRTANGITAQFASSSNTVAITSERAFRDAVIGRPLQLVSDDVDATLQFDADNTARGTIVRSGDQARAMALDWVWEGEVYCRTGSVGELALDRDCETVEVLPGVGIRLSYVSGTKPDEYWEFQ